MPDVRDRTYEQAQQDLTAQELPTARITATARHRDVTLAADHETWWVCEARPRG